MISDIKKIASILAVVICAAIFSGCIQSSQEIVIDEDGMALVNFSAIADKSQAGSEISQLTWQVQQLIPELNTNYESRNYTFEEEYTEYAVYEWTAKNNVPVNDIRGASWKAENGSYEFQLSLDLVFSPEEIVEADKNDVVMTITLTMPDEITFANTPFVEGDTARWTLTKELLSQNNTILRAITG
jgi:hypothetical protein